MRWNYRHMKLIHQGNGRNGTALQIKSSELHCDCYGRTCRLMPRFVRPVTWYRWYHNKQKNILKLDVIHVLKWWKLSQIWTISWNRYFLCANKWNSLKAGRVYKYIWCYIGDDDHIPTRGTFALLPPTLQKKYYILYLNIFKYYIFTITKLQRYIVHQKHNVENVLKNIKQQK